MRNQKFTHDFACETLAPLLAVAVEQNSLFDACRPNPQNIVRSAKCIPGFLKPCKSIAKSMGLITKNCLPKSGGKPR